MPIYRTGANIYTVVQAWGQSTGGAVNTAGTFDMANRASPQVVQQRWVSPLNISVPSLYLVPGPIAHSEIGLSVAATTTTTATDRQAHKEPGRSITIAATTTATDRANWKGNTGLSVPVVATVACTDALRFHYQETGRSITVAGTVTSTASAHYKEVGPSTGSAFLFAEDWNQPDASNWDFLKWPHQRPYDSISGGLGLIATGGSPNMVYADQYVEDFEFKVKVAWPSSIAGQYPEICWRMYSGLASGSAGGYALQVNGAGNAADIFKIDGYSSIGNASDASLTAAGTRWFKIRVVGTNHKVKWWMDGSGEPGTWNIDITDTTPQNDSAGVPVVGGTIGFRYWGSNPISYDDLTLTDLSTPAIPIDGSLRMLSNGKVNMASNPNPITADTDLSWCCWFKCNSTASGAVDAPIMSLFSGGSNYFITTMDSARQLRHYMDTGDLNSSFTMTLGTWYFVGVSRSIAGGTDLYWAPQGTTTLSKVHSSSVGHVNGVMLRLLSGEYGSNPYTSGCAFKIWKAALTQAQLEAEMATYSAVRTANLFASWPMRNGLDWRSENPVDNNLNLIWEMGGVLSGPVAAFLTDAPSAGGGAGSGLSVTAAATIACTDYVAQRYDETGRSITIAATVTSTTAAHYKEVGTVVSTGAPAVLGTPTTGLAPGASQSSVIVNKPAGTTVGETLLIFFSSESVNSSASCPGFTQRASAVQTPNASYLFERIVDGSEGATFTITTNAGSSYLAVWCARLTPGATFDAAQGAATPTTVNPPIPQVTTTGADRFVLTFVKSNNNLMGAISGLTLGGIWDPDFNGWYYKTQAVAGPTGTPTFTNGGTYAVSMITTAYQGLAVSGLPAATIAATITAADTYTPGQIHYTETGLSIPVAAGVTSTDVAHFKETPVITVAATVTATDFLNRVWAGSAATVGVAATSGSFAPGLITWTASTASVGVAGASGTFDPGTATWMASLASAGVAGASGSFAPGPITWAGSTATVGVSGVTGLFGAGAATWVGSNATVAVAAASDSFTGGPATWDGSVATVGVSGASAPFVPAAITWIGNEAEVGITGNSGSWSAANAPQTWFASEISIGIEGTSGEFGTDLTWVGSTATIGAAGSSGSFVPDTATWVGSNAVVGVAGASAAFLGGTATWTGSAAAVSVAADSGQFLAGGTTVWVGSQATIGVLGASGTMVPGDTSWTGSVTSIGIAGFSSSFSSGDSIWLGSIATVSIAAPISTWTTAVLWQGSPATISVVAVLDPWKEDVVWHGSEAIVEVIGRSGSFLTSAFIAMWNGQVVAQMQWGDQTVVDAWMLPV